MAPNVDYTTLTADNFFIQSNDNISTSKWIVNDWGDCVKAKAAGVSSLTAVINISYNANDGLLTSSLSASATGGWRASGNITYTASSTVSVHTYLIY